MTIGVNLLYEYNQRGPGKVISNLLKGFKEIQIDCISNSLDQHHYCGLLQSISNVHNKNLNSALCGPNLFVLPTEWGSYCKNYNHYIVPSQWVHDLYRKFSELDHATIDIYPSGIDTEFWKKSEHTSHNRCLVYFKNRSDQELSQVISKLNQLSIEYDILKYGNYIEADLIRACNKCNFAILLTGTESQGIGYMEILSTGLPCFVLNTNSWEYESNKVPATSVPYFDTSCGLIADTVDLLGDFVQNISSYNSREFICNSFSLSKRANEYYKLLAKYDCIMRKN